MLIEIQISSVTSLLMNRFNIVVDERKVKDKNLTPREDAFKRAYIDDEGKLFYPTNNIFSCIMEAGKFHKDGKGKITTARGSLLPAYVSMQSETIPFTQPTTEWEVDTRAVVTPSTGGRIACHRAKINNWKLDFSLSLDPRGFSSKTLRMLVEDAGSKVGLGDFRPQRKGSFGKFEITKWAEL